MGRTSKNKNRRKMTSKKKSKITNKRRQRRERQRRERQKGGMQWLFGSEPEQEEPEPEQEEGGMVEYFNGYDNDIFRRSATIQREIDAAEKLVSKYSSEGEITDITKIIQIAERAKTAARSMEDQMGLYPDREPDAGIISDDTGPNAKYEKLKRDITLISQHDLKDAEEEAAVRRVQQRLAAEQEQREAEQREATRWERERGLA